MCEVISLHKDQLNAAGKRYIIKRNIYIIPTFQATISGYLNLYSEGKVATNAIRNIT